MLQRGVTVTIFVFVIEKKYFEFLRMPCSFDEYIQLNN